MKCSYCGKEGIYLIKEDKPYTVDHFQCTECDSTFTIQEVKKCQEEMEQAQAKKAQELVADLEIATRKQR